MATSLLAMSSDSTHAGTYYSWAHQVSTAIAAMGWIQTADTGQIVWPASIAIITSATGNGTTTTFTYTISQGPALQVGQSIAVNGFVTNAGWNATFTILSIPASNTFTVSSAVNATESGSIVGGVNLRIAISQATGNGATNTYTYTNTDGILVNGQSVVITGCTTGGFNGTFTVASISGSTFTTVAGGITHAPEAESGVGLITCVPCRYTNGRSGTTIPPTQSSSLYEVWRMNDSFQSVWPIYLRVAYDTQTSNSGVFFIVGVGTATNGAGTLSGVNTGNIGVWNVNASTASQGTGQSISYVSGSASRLTMRLYPNTNWKGGFFSIQRSRNSIGVETGEYASLVLVQGPTNSSNAAPTIVQSVLGFSGLTVTETKLTVLVNTGTTTGEWGQSIIACPVLPVVGYIGHPMIDVLVGKSTDWFDQTKFSMSLYGTAHNYLVENTAFINVAGYLAYGVTTTCALLYRFE